MYISKGDFATYIYPFADNREDASISSAIVVSNERVRWNGQYWTPESFAEYVSKLSSAMFKAFELAAKK
jgi:hypothetical protein